MSAPSSSTKPVVEVVPIIIKDITGVLDKEGPEQSGSLKRKNDDPTPLAAKTKKIGRRVGLEVWPYPGEAFKMEIIETIKPEDIEKYDMICKQYKKWRNNYRNVLDFHKDLLRQFKETKNEYDILKKKIIEYTEGERQIIAKINPKLLVVYDLFDYEIVGVSEKETKANSCSQIQELTEKYQAVVLNTKETSPGQRICSIIEMLNEIQIDLNEALEKQNGHLQETIKKFEEQIKVFEKKLEEFKKKMIENRDTAAKFIGPIVHPMCPICLRYYEHSASSSKGPRVLQCGHTHCRECTERLLKNGQVVCTDCRRSHTMENITGVIVNYHLMPKK